MAKRRKDSSTETKVSIDWDTIPFPSSRITLGQLRQSVAGDNQLLEVVIYNLISLETEIANDLLFAIQQKSAGHQIGHVAQLLRSEKLKELGALYVSVGLAAGPHEASRLTAELESSIASKVAGTSPS